MFVLNKPLNVDVMRMVFDTCMLSFVNKIYKSKLFSEKIIGNYHRIVFSIKFKQNKMSFYLCSGSRRQTIPRDQVWTNR